MLDRVVPIGPLWTLNVWTRDGNLLHHNEDAGWYQGVVFVRDRVFELRHAGEIDEQEAGRALLMIESLSPGDALELTVGACTYQLRDGLMGFTRL